MQRARVLRAPAAAVGAAGLVLSVAGGARPVTAVAQGEEPVGEARRCLALSMYWEARNEGREGMRAIGSVVLNRVEHADFPGTPCEVVFDGGETPPCQFSWWCDGRSDTPRESEPWETALELAGEMLEERREDPTDGALFFHAADIAVPWRVERTRTVRILGHVYYR